MLRVSRMTIHRRIAARTIPALCIGRSPRIPRDFVQGLVDATRAGRTVVIEDLASPGTSAS
jgi:excisionase family DNA binding protein